VVFSEGAAALLAAEALEAVTMLPEAFAAHPAIVAGHCGFSLESTAGLPDNEFAGSSRRKLWWILAPISVSALIGAFALLGQLYHDGSYSAIRN
jgi:hypothetical protein